MTSNRILVVDDDPMVRQFVDLVLTQQGYAVSTAAASETALQALGREAFNLVLLDIRMPGMTGLDVLRLMKARASSPKILMMTGQRDPATIRRSIETGAAGYLAKPFTPQDLVKRVRAVLRGAETVRPRAEPPPPPPARPPSPEQLILD